MGWHERHAPFRWGSRGISRPEALNLEAWNFMLRDTTYTCVLCVVTCGAAGVVGGVPTSSLCNFAIVHRALLCALPLCIVLCFALPCASPLEHRALLRFAIAHRALLAFRFANVHRALLCFALRFAIAHRALLCALPLHIVLCSLSALPMCIVLCFALCFANVHRALLCFVLRHCASCFALPCASPLCIVLCFALCFAIAHRALLCFVLCQCASCFALLCLALCHCASCFALLCALPMCIVLRIVLALENVEFGSKCLNSKVYTFDWQKAIFVILGFVRRTNAKGASLIDKRELCIGNCCFWRELCVGRFGSIPPFLV